MTVDLSYALITALNELLTVVVPSLRAVTLDFVEAEKMLYIRFFFDAKITEELADLPAYMEIEIYPGSIHDHYGLSDEVIHLPYPNFIPIQGRIIYLRKESICPKIKQEKPSKLWPNKEPLILLLLDMQQALLCKVTPELRAVLVRIIENQSLLKIVFYYDGEISKENFELASTAIAEAIVAFSEYTIEKQILRLDFPKKIPSKFDLKESRFAYFRKE